MAGHSHWKSIKNKKGAVDAKRGKVFSKLAKLITVAARHGGGNPVDNLRLRYAMDRARTESMPKDSVERAVKKGTGELQGEELAELVYEGITPGGVSLVIEVLTGNRNRTGGEIRNLLEKRGGSLGKANSVLWKFDRKGVLGVAESDATEEELFNVGVEAGAENVEVEDGVFHVYTRVDDFESVRAAFQSFLQKKRERPEKKWGEAEDERPVFTRSEVIYVPQNPIQLEGERALQVLGIVSDLEDHEDVQNVFGDFDVPEALLEQLAAE
ncbi:MAG TPA: YebC/PmpR family DNA-binding transcriptional regulator [Planctomycetota bacterium]|nr:YebC/PmpR family DNA-binding transcriptional regulator [Planctomycetota bacterium]